MNCKSERYPIPLEAALWGWRSLLQFAAPTGLDPGAVANRPV